MAIYTEQQYPGKVNPSNSNYPYGSAKDVSQPGAGDGFPLQKEWLNDLFGFQQALLKKAGISPNGRADTATKSQYLASMQALCGRIFKSVKELTQDQTMNGGDFALLTRYYTNEVDESTGVLIYEADVPKSSHDGILFFSPTIPYTSGANYRDGVGETDPNGKGVWRLASGTVYRSTSLRVPTQIPDLSSALEMVADLKISKDSQLVIQLAAGYKIPNRVLIKGADYANVVISSEDDQVKLTDDFDASGVFTVQNGANAPLINIIVNIENRNCTGLFVQYGANAVIAQGKGFINAGGYSLQAYVGSRVSAIGAILTGSGRGVYVSTSSQVALDNADLSNCVGERALIVTDCSQVSFNNGKMNNCTGGIRASGACSLDLRRTELKNCTGDIVIDVTTSVISANECNFSNLKKYGIVANNSSIVSAADAIFDNGDIALYIREASSCSADNVSIDGFSTAIQVEGGSNLDANNATITGSSYSGVRCLSGSTANISGSTIRDGDFVVNIQDSSTCCAVNCVVSGSKFDAVLCQFSSRLDARNLKIENSSRQGVCVYEASTASLASCEVKNCVDRGIDVRTSSNVDCENATITNCANRGIQALDNSRVSAKNCTVDGSSWGITAWNASTIEAANCVVKNYTENGFRAMYASTLNTYGSVVYQSKSGTPNNNDIRSSHGSSISALNTFCNVEKTKPAGTNIAVNTLTSEGVIYR